MNKVLLQTIATTLLNLFLLDMNYDKSIIELPFLLLLSMLAKILKDQILITISLIKCLNFKFLQY